MNAKKGDTVKIHYTGKMEDDTVFDSSENREPLQFTIGEGKIIPGVEQAVLGMAPGESKIVKVTSKQAYGPHRSDLVVELERKEFPKHIVLAEGKILRFKQPDGSLRDVKIKKITQDMVILDANHPLAGENLVFDILLLEISKS
jgi:FKBP-type peptidyl-prolyl cis-trans isomerase 2